MFKKKFTIIVFLAVFCTLSLHAAPSKSEVQQTFKNIIKKEWNKQFFVSGARTARAFDSSGRWKHAFIDDNDAWVAFHPRTIRESSGRLSITGHFEDKDGLEYEDGIYEFVFVKRSGKWLIGQVFYSEDGKYSKFDFAKGVFVENPKVIGL